MRCPVTTASRLACMISAPSRAKQSFTKATFTSQPEIIILITSVSILKKHHEHGYVDVRSLQTRSTRCLIFQ